MKILLSILLLVAGHIHTSAQKIELVKYNSINQLDSAILANMTKDKIPGLQTSYGYSQRLQFDRNYGLADIQNDIYVNDSTVFPIFSVTKLFTAISVIQLIQKVKYMRINQLKSCYLILQNT